MANIEELDFRLVLQDGDFDTKAKALLEQAKKLNTELSNLLEVTSKVKLTDKEQIANAQKMNDILKERNKVESLLNNRRKKRIDLEKQISSELERQSRIDGTERTINISNTQNVAYLDRMGEKQKEFNKEVAKSGRLWNELKNITMAYFSIMGAERLVSNMVRISAEFEKQRISLEAILRDVNGADKIFNQIKSLAVVSPFSFKELVTYTKQLSAFSVPMGELYDTTKMLADVSAGLGVGMDRLILAYGQIRSAAFLRGQEVRQMTESGVPILQELSKTLTEIEGKYVSVGEVFDKISSRQVTFEMVADIFKKMTSEGGKFYKMQETLADTLSGKISNLRDAYEIMFSEIGEKSNGILVKSVDALRSLAENYEKIGKVLADLVVGFGAYRTALILTELAEGKILATNHKLLASFASLLQSVGKFIKANPYAALASALAAVGMAVYHLRTEETAADKVLKSFNDTISKGNAEMRSEISTLNRLYEKMRLSGEGTKEFDEAKQKMMSHFGDYINQLRQEGVEVDNLASIYGKLKNNIKESISGRYRNFAVDAARVQLEATEQEILEWFNKYEEHFGRWVGPDFVRANDADKEKLLNYIFGVGDQEALLRHLDKNLLNPSIEKMRKKWAEAEAKYNDIEKRYGNKKEEESKNETIIEDWQKRIQDIQKLAESKGKIKLNFQVETMSLDSAIAELKERIKDTEEQIQVNEGIKPEVVANLKERLKWLQKINNEVFLGKATENKGNTEKTNPRIAQIKYEIDAYKKLIELRKELEDLNVSNPQQMVVDIYGSIYGDMVKNNPKEEIENLILELERLGKTDKKAAEAARNLRAEYADKNAKDFVDSLKEMAKAAKEWSDMMEHLNSVQEIAGEGSTLQISKIVASYTKKVREIEQRKAENREKIQKQYETGGISRFQYNYGIAKIDASADVEFSNALTEAKDDAKKALEGLYKSWRESNVDFTQLSDKSISQLRELRKQLSDFSTEDITDDKVIAYLQSLGLSLEDAIKLFEELKTIDLNRVNGQLKDKQIKTWKSVAKSIVSATSAVKDYADAVGNVELADLMGFVSSASDVMSSIIQGFATGGPIGAAFAGLSTIVSKIFTSMAESEKKAQEYAKALREAKAEAAAIANSLALAKGVDTIFGEDSIKNIDNAVGKLRDIRKEIDEVEKALDTYVANVKIAGQEGWGTTEREIWNARAKGAGVELYDENGNLVLDALKAIKAKYIELPDAEKAWLDDTIAILERRAEAYDQFKEAIQGIFGELSSSIADSMLDAYAELGDATAAIANDMDGIFSDLARSIAKNLIQSFAIKNVLNGLEEEVTYLMERMSADDATPSEIAKLFSNLAGNIYKGSSEIADFTNRIGDALKQYGISLESSSDNTLANGIKTITEDTANLLASYVNGIRADVSVIRQGFGELSADVKVLLGLVPQTNTLENYLQQIVANQQNTISWMQSVTGTSERGGLGIRAILD